MSEAVQIKAKVNGRDEILTGATNTTLADALREQCGLRGTKVSCDQGVCGACTVLVDGRPTASCMTFLFVAEGHEILTIEGLPNGDGSIHPIQQAFIEESAFQCGYCTPGMVMLVKSLLDTLPDADDTVIQRWLAANICRCTGQISILRSVKRARALIRESRKSAP